jgi:hypothetical protein
MRQRFYALVLWQVKNERHRGRGCRWRGCGGRGQCAASPGVATPGLEWALASAVRLDSDRFNSAVEDTGRGVAQQTERFGSGILGRSAVAAKQGTFECALKLPMLAFGSMAQGSLGGRQMKRIPRRIGTEKNRQGIFWLSPLMSAKGTRESPRGHGAKKGRVFSCKLKIAIRTAVPHSYRPTRSDYVSTHRRYIGGFVDGTACRLLRCLKHLTHPI